MEDFRKEIHQKSVNTIRTLSIDAIDKANSGHPGLPLGAAPMAYVLWTHFMKHNPSNPDWSNRDRFVLSAGHGSMLLYSLLHLCGYDLELEEIKQFRQWGSLTPGHPEYGRTPGVEATTGPLGQGMGMAVGMAMAEAHLASRNNREGFPVVDHYTYALCGDGDMMEGITGEAASLAGHLGLGKLIVLYDSNDISLDGDLNLSFSENVRQRFEACGWHVQFVRDGNDLKSIHSAIAAAKVDERPSLIEIKTVIGYGSPNKSGTSGSHGVPLGYEETLLTKKFYGWPATPAFFIPEDVKAHFAEVKKRGKAAEVEWRQLFKSYEQAHPGLAQQFRDAERGRLPQGWDSTLPAYGQEDRPIATREASGRAINALAGKVPHLIGGSADLETSTKTGITGSGKMVRGHYAGRNVSFGVREFAMGAALNGMLLHRGVRAFAGTFLVFSDYLRPAVRLASLMKLPVIYVFTHDSIAVGVDGPTHEPVEHLAALRCIPGLTVLRPADANETSAAWRYAVGHSSGPAALILSRQALPILPGTSKMAARGLMRGAYVLAESESRRQQVQLIATGSEVALALKARQLLVSEGIPANVISMPSRELFEKQPRSYRERVLLSDVPALAIEMGSPQGWHRIVGRDGDVMGISEFGASAPADKVIEEYGFTAEHVAARAKLLAGHCPN